MFQLLPLPLPLLLLFQLLPLLLPLLLLFQLLPLLLPLLLLFQLLPLLLPLVWTAGVRRLHGLSCEQQHSVCQRLRQLPHPQADKRQQQNP
jgi:hypothetical protein